MAHATGQRLSRITHYLRTHHRRGRFAAPAQRPVRPHARGASARGRLAAADGGQSGGQIWRRGAEGMKRFTRSSAVQKTAIAYRAALLLDLRAMIVAQLTIF